ncbi:phosphotransferase [Terribacillus saccharophilus]|uniref:phosphotransferase n=1 Tax=Terribacillus saccharophilus TaxID=361277 RepID=UPI003981A614
MTDITWLESYIREPIKIWKTIETGWDHEVHVLNGRWVLRIPREENGFIRTEQQLLLKLQIKTDIRLPVFQSCTVPDGKEAMLYRFISGNPISMAIPSQDMTEIAVQLGSLLSHLHHMEADPCLPKRDESYYERLLNAVRKFYPDMPLSVINQTEQLFSVLQTDHNAVVHGDLRGAHILWDKTTRKIGILDFSDAHVGDPAIDFAGISQVGNTFMEQVLQHYDGDKEGISLRAGQLHRLGLYYDLLQNGPSDALLKEMEREPTK